MKKNNAAYLYFFAGILFGISSILCFSSNNKMLGITYIFLAITFISLGVAYKNKKNK